QGCSASYKTFICIIQHFFLLLSEFEFSAVLINRLYFLEEAVIKADIIPVLGSKGCNFHADSLKRVVCIGRIEASENPADLGQKLAAVFQGLYCVFESRCLWIIY